MNNRSIGMFDSGIGGHTVLKEFQKIMPNEDFIYYADSMHLPYGDKTKEQIISFSDNISKILINNNVKAIVIACGTASSLAYNYLKANYTLPIFDIITPVAKELSINKFCKKIGIMATEASVKSHIWENTIKSLNCNVEIYSIACPTLVPLAEKGLQNSIEAKIDIQNYLKSFRDVKIDTLILGCTHYPLFEDLIKEELGNSINIINPGKVLAIKFKEYMDANSLNANYNKNGTVFFMNSKKSP